MAEVIETGRENKKEQPEIKMSIDVKGIKYNELPLGPKGGMRKVPYETNTKLDLSFSGGLVEFFHEGKGVNRFKLLGKVTNKQINDLATVLLDIGSFEKKRDAREWIVKENLFERISEEKQRLDDLRKGQKKTELVEKYELKKKPEVRKDVSTQVLTLLLQNKWAEATEVVCMKIFSELNIVTTRHVDKPEMWVYCTSGENEGIYIPHGETYIQEVCRNILGDAYSNKFFKSVVEKIRADTYMDQEKLFADPPLNLIVLKNGILDLETKELLPFTPQLRFFSKHPVVFDLNKDCPNVKSFFKSVLKNDDEIKVIQETFGYLLYREYFIEKSLMFLGNGRNGKGKTILLMKNFIGLDNCSSIPLDDLEKDLYSQSELFKKNTNICGDLSKTGLQHTGKFKSLTGRDPINSARKYLSRIRWVNYAKMIFACNELPLTYDNTEAFFDRWIIIDFPFKFIPEKNHKKLTEEQKKSQKIQDPNIIDKLSTQNELSGLLNWALEGLERLRKKKEFSYSPSTQEVKKKWLRKSDSCLAFIMDHIESSDYDFMLKQDFKLEYTKYCRKHNLRISSDKVIKHILETYVGACDDRKNVGMERKRVWVGLCFVSEKTPSGQGGQDGQGISKRGKNEYSCIGAKTVDKSGTLATKEKLTTLKKVDQTYHRCTDCNNSPCDFQCQVGYYYCSICATDDTNFIVEEEVTEVTEKNETEN